MITYDEISFQKDKNISDQESHEFESQPGAFLWMDGLFSFLLFLFVILTPTSGQCFSLNPKCEETLRAWPVCLNQPALALSDASTSASAYLLLCGLRGEDFVQLEAHDFALAGEVEDGVVLGVKA